MTTPAHIHVERVPNPRWIDQPTLATRVTNTATREGITIYRNPPIPTGMVGATECRIDGVRCFFPGLKAAKRAAIAALTTAP